MKYKCRGIVVCRIKVAPGSKIVNTNQFEPGFEVFTNITAKDLWELWHPLAIIHLVEFDEDGEQDVILVEEFIVKKCLYNYSKTNLEALARKLNSMINDITFCYHEEPCKREETCRRNFPPKHDVTYMKIEDSQNCEYYLPVPKGDKNAR